MSMTYVRWVYQGEQTVGTGNQVNMSKSARQGIAGAIGPVTSRRGTIMPRCVIDDSYPASTILNQELS